MASSTPTKEDTPPPAVKSVSARKVFLFIQEAISELAKCNPEMAIKLYLECALAADRLAVAANKDTFAPITYELFTQAFSLYEGSSGDTMLQSRCVPPAIGALMACRRISKEDYERLIMKTAQYAAKLLKKTDQCEMVAMCSYLFYVVDEDVSDRESN